MARVVEVSVFVRQFYLWDCPLGISTSSPAAWASLSDHTLLHIRLPLFTVVGPAPEVSCFSSYIQWLMVLIKSNFKATFGKSLIFLSFARMCKVKLVLWNIRSPSWPAVWLFSLGRKGSASGVVPHFSVTYYIWRFCSDLFSPADRRNYIIYKTAEGPVTPLAWRVVWLPWTKLIPVETSTHQALCLRKKKKKKKKYVDSLEKGAGGGQRWVLCGENGP